MARLLHKPEGSVEQRLQEAEAKYGVQIADLMGRGWGDVSIAKYLGLDRYTVNRFRRKHSLSRKFRTDGTPEYNGGPIPEHLKPTVSFV